MGKSTINIELKIIKSKRESNMEDKFLHCSALWVAPISTARENTEKEIRILRSHTVPAELV